MQLPARLRADSCCCGRDRVCVCGLTRFPCVDTVTAYRWLNLGTDLEQLVTQVCRVPATQIPCLAQSVLGPGSDKEGQYRRPGDEKKGFYDLSVSLSRRSTLPIIPIPVNAQLDPRRPFTVHSPHTVKCLPDQRYLGPRAPNQSHPSSHLRSVSGLLLLSVPAIVTSSSCSS